LIRNAAVTLGTLGTQKGLGAAHLGLELGGDFAGLRESAGLLLGEHELVVHRDLEDSSGSLDELRPDAQLLLDLFRQTGGAREVVSDGAVLDRDVRRHVLLLSGPDYRTERCPPLVERNEMAEAPVEGV
jgi:hypothetical protein